jgi:hypothetical protein
MSRAASRPVTNPAKQAISQTFRKTRSVGKVDVGADVEDAERERRPFIRLLHEGLYLHGLTSVERACFDETAFRLRRSNDFLQFVAVTTPGENGEALASEPLDDLGADVVARSDHGDGGTPSFHCSYPRHATIDEAS